MSVGATGQTDSGREQMGGGCSVGHRPDRGGTTDVPGTHVFLDVSSSTAVDSVGVPVPVSV